MKENASASATPKQSLKHFVNSLSGSSRAALASLLTLLSVDDRELAASMGASRICQGTIDSQLPLLLARSDARVWQRRVLSSTLCVHLESDRFIELLAELWKRTKSRRQRRDLAFGFMCYVGERPLHDRRFLRAADELLRSSDRIVHQRALVALRAIRPIHSRHVVLVANVITGKKPDSRLAVAICTLRSWVQSGALATRELARLRETRPFLSAIERQSKDADAKTQAGLALKVIAGLMSRENPMGLDTASLPTTSKR